MEQEAARLYNLEKQKAKNFKNACMGCWGNSKLRGSIESTAENQILMHMKNLLSPGISIKTMNNCGRKALMNSLIIRQKVQITENVKTGCNGRCFL